MKKLYTILFFLTALFSSANAQIFPPDFICVKGDSLFWELPNNTCGAFNSYDIYGSQSPNGPFVLLASISNPAQTAYYHINPSGEQWFFYLLSNYTCPGETAIPSDTLDNRPPEVSPIEYVTVNGDEAFLSWQPSPSPEVYAYIIYRQTSIGVIPVDTVFSGTTYLDLNSNPGQQSETYLVNALDRCGNTSIFDLKHKTIFLEANIGQCDRAFSLHWNKYQNWLAGIEKQELWVSENGGAFALAQTLLATDSVFAYPNVQDGSTYCFYVKAFEGGTGFTSTSNETCLTADIVQPVEGLYLKNISVGANNQAVVTWVWNPTAEVKEAQLLSSDQNAAYQAISTFSPVPQPPLLAAENGITDISDAAGLGKVFYKIQAQDLCDSITASGYGSTIFLTAISAQGNLNHLEWTGFDMENSIVDAYSIFKITGNTTSQIGTIGATATSFDAEFDPSNPEDAESCYFVVAQHTVTAPDGTQMALESKSNIACVEQRVRILVPNAFVPEGFNNEFKPLLIFDNLLSYEMRIFDRYGQELFYSNIPDDGWNGEKNDKPLPQGTYVYMIKAIQADGRSTEKRGTLLLLR